MNPQSFLLSFVCLLLLATGAVRAQSTLEVVDGPQAGKRKQLLIDITAAENKGVGIKPFMNAFASIEDLVRSQAAPDEIEKQTERLRAALTDQMERVAGIRSDHKDSEPVVKVNPATVAYLRAVEAYIKSKWTPSSGLEAPTSVEFDVTKDGNIKQIHWKDDEESPAAKTASVKKMESFVKLPAPPEPLTICVTLCNNPKEIDVWQYTDFSLYMANLQRKIKKDWFPPKADHSLSLVVKFRVWRDGSITELQVDKSTGIREADEAGLRAVKAAAPFRPLPAVAPRKVDVQFSFDYNAKGSI